MSCIHIQFKCIKALSGSSSQQGSNSNLPRSLQVAFPSISHTPLIPNTDDSTILFDYDFNNLALSAGCDTQPSTAFTAAVQPLPVPIFSKLLCHRSAFAFALVRFVAGIVGKFPGVSQFRDIAFASQYNVAPGNLVVAKWGFAFDESVLRRFLIGKTRVKQR